MLKITYNFTKYVIILTLFIINSFGGEMENNNISLDQDKILQVNIGGQVFKPTLYKAKGTLRVLKIPEDEKILRMKSVEINESELPIVA